MPTSRTRTSLPTTAVHPRGRVHSTTFRLVLVVTVIVTLALAWAQPMLPSIIEPGAHACPEATLPLRLAAKQVRVASTAELLEWVSRDGLRTAAPALVLDRRSPPIHIVVLAYLAGNPVDVEVLLTPFGSTEPTWRRLLTPEIPSIARGMHLFPYYLAAEVPRADYGRAFPIDGPYHLVARPARDPQSAYVDGLCMAEAATWVLVVRR